MSAVSKWGNPLPEGCHIFLDLRQLPEAQDGSDDLVPLSPFTIEWGVEKPWDETNPAVLNITLIDQGGRYSKSVNGLMGHRLTVRPAWELQGTYDESPLCFALFDGYVTDVEMLAHDGGRNRIKLTASDRIYILRTDCRKGPNDGTDAQAARGYQWWLQGSMHDTLKRWLNFDGIPAFDITYDTFSTPPKASERHSFMDFCERKVTRQIDGKYNFEVDRLFFMAYQDARADQVPQFRDMRAYWDTDIILTGPTIVLGDYGTNLNDDYRTPAASRVIIDADPTLESAADYYTQVEMKYAHRGLTNPGATAVEQAQAATTYEFTVDGSRVAQIATQTRNGETCLSIEAEWTEYPSNAASSAASIDMSRAVNAIAESNNRVRLPELTFRGATPPILPARRVFVPRQPVRRHRAGHHRRMVRDRRHPHLRRDRKKEPVDAPRACLARTQPEKRQTDVRRHEKTHIDGHVQRSRLGFGRASARHQDRYGPEGNGNQQGRNTLWRRRSVTVFPIPVTATKCANCPTSSGNRPKASTRHWPASTTTAPTQTSSPPAWPRSKDSWTPSGATPWCCTTTTTHPSQVPSRSLKARRTSSD